MRNKYISPEIVQVQFEMADVICHVSYGGAGNGLSAEAKENSSFFECDDEECDLDEDVLFP